MLGATETPFETPAEDVIREVARRMGVEDTFERTTVAVDFDLCVRCGGCMVGCRYGAKNTLDRNYLRLAEEGGAVVHRRARGDAARAASTAAGRSRRRARALAAAAARARSAREQVVLAAGVLGTLKLLLALRRRRPERRRARALELGGDRRRRRARPRVDYSRGNRDRLVVRCRTRDTRIEPVRYPKGSSLMGSSRRCSSTAAAAFRVRSAGSATLARHPLDALSARAVALGASGR